MRVFRPAETHVKRLVAGVPRRQFLRSGLAGMAAWMAPSYFAGCSSEDEKEAGLNISSNGGAGGGTPDAALPPLRSNISRIGTLGAADANGVMLPEGFSSRIIARTGEAPVSSSAYLWHGAPDGGATYPMEDGGWIYVSNAEALPPAGGAGALRFDASGTIVDAYSILGASSLNCAGGATPWGTWLSCEEHPNGQVFECDPQGVVPAVARPALGMFKHEAVAVDRVNQHLYLTEDETDGRFYRYVPDALTPDGFADLTAGRLEVAVVLPDNRVEWRPVPDPGFTLGVATRLQVPESTPFSGGEGIWYRDGIVFFSTKGNNRVWAYDVAEQRLRILYDASIDPNPVLRGVDNLTGTCCGDVLVAEDGDDMQIVAILPDGTVKPLLQIVGHDGSEITGPAFDPSGTRLYFSSQRGTGINGFFGSGITYEVSGPFHSRG